MATGSGMLRGLSRDKLRRFEDVHLAESLLPNAAHLTQKRIRKDPTPVCASA